MSDNEMGMRGMVGDEGDARGFFADCPGFPSWPGQPQAESRPSTFLRPRTKKDVDGGDKRGHDAKVGAVELRMAEP
jgi:hypothetical protein